MREGPSKSFYRERGNQFLDVKGEAQVEDLYKGLSTNARNWDGVVSSSNEDSRKELERRGRASASKFELSVECFVW